MQKKKSPVNELQRQTEHIKDSVNADKETNDPFERKLTESFSMV